ncbi:putative aldouronate transport system permease protein [Lachnospiraceae bacterium NLAE-zl-G231]|nr:putative aldouronate transport system permease protein [Lachnospiraceae bacterium NLAE-zl-G231]
MLQKKKGAVLVKALEKPKAMKKRLGLKAVLKNNWQLYLLVLPAVIYFVVFNYLPLYGIQIAFKDYKAVDGIAGSAWVGLKHFKNFFNAYYFKRLLSNTLLLNVYYLLWSFPVPLILAILLNQIRGTKKKRFIQTSIYVPYFISTVVLAGMLYIFLSPTSGILNFARTALGLKAIDFMSDASAFRSIYIISGIWQAAGYGTILYIATLTGIDLSLYEAAEIDGASIWQKIRYIDIPSLIPTAMMVFILDCGKMLASDTNKALVMQTPGNIPTSDIIGVYVYNVGLGSGQFSYTAAIGLFINIINFILIVSVNQLSKRMTDVGLF